MNNKRIKLDGKNRNDNHKYKNNNINIISNNINFKPLSNLLIVKILNYAIKDSIKDDKHLTFMGTLSLVCKSWTIFILPKLDDEIIFKNDDYLYTYLKVRDSIRALNNSAGESSFKLCKNNNEMNAALSLLQLPTFVTGTYLIYNDQDERANDYGSINGWNIINHSQDYNIYIDGIKCGTIFSPDITKIEEMSKPSSFGKADKTVYDESIRKGFHIEGDRINVPYFNYDKQTFDNYQTKNQYLKNSPYFEVKLYKIHIYKEGGHFEDHIDTINSMNHVGTYIVPLGVDTYKGGEFLISENETFDETTKEYRIEATSRIDPNCFDFKWIAFYNDCIHKVKPVTKGTRIVLQFNIYIREDQSKKTWEEKSIYIKNKLPDMMEGSESNYHESIKYSKNNQFLTLNLEDDKIVEMMVSNERNLKRVTSALDNIMNNNNVNTGLFLVHLYKAHINQDNLKGIDRVIWDHIKNHYGEDRIKIRTFIITKCFKFSEDDDEDDDYDIDEDPEVIKIAMLTPKTINQQSTLIKGEDKDTLMFCGNKYSNLYSIYSKPLPSTGNEERYTQDLGCFSAIIIKGINSKNQDKNKSNKQNKSYKSYKSKKLNKSTKLIKFYKKYNKYYKSFNLSNK